MSVLDWFRRPRLVPVAEFEDHERAATAWGRLQDADIPASIDADPGLLGGRPVARVMVEEEHVAESQRLIADLVHGSNETTDQP